jgi:hypothetical protein
MFDSAANTAIAAARRAATSGDAFHCCELMRLILSVGIGEPAEFAAIAASIATGAQASGDVRKAKAYWEIEADWHRLAKDSTAQQKARLAAAEAAVTEAENRTTGNGASFMAAASLMGQAIEELRQAGATKERVSASACRRNWVSMTLRQRRRMNC